MKDIANLMRGTKKTLSCVLRNLADEIEESGLNLIWTVSDGDIRKVIHRAAENLNNGKAKGS